MGYYVRLTKSTVVLKQENLEQILERWKELNGPKYNHLKTGGGWSGGKQTGIWYSWMSEDYDKKATAATDVLDELGFEYDTDEEGNVHIQNYDSKTGAEDHFMRHIADLIEEDQYMVWSGEDGAAWVWHFEGNKMVEKSLEELINIGKNKEKKEVVSTQINVTINNNRFIL